MIREEMSEHREGTTSTRREMILSAASGFVLAASGLLVPDWLEEAEAREGALGGAQGGRRGQNHRRHRHKRTHGDRKRKHKNRKPGDLVPTHPAIVIRNKRADSVQTQGWTRYAPDAVDEFFVPSGWEWKAVPQVREFRSGWFDVIVQIGTDRLVLFQYTWPYPPSAAIYSGGMEEHQHGIPSDKDRLANDSNMFVDESISVPGITAKRIKDSDVYDNNRYVWLQVELT